MYKNGFVLNIRNKGKTLKDKNYRVELPFYEEYSVFLKNTNDRKAVAKIFIDGEDICDGKGFILSPGESMDIERFVKDLDEGRKLQFVPKSDERITEKQKSSIDLGVIEVKFKMEEHKSFVDEFYPWIRKKEDEDKWTRPYEPYRPFKTYDTISQKVYPKPVMRFAQVQSTSFSKQGGTVEGSRSTQTFRNGRVEKLEEKETIIKLQLVPSEEATTIEDSRYVYCNNCGKKNLGEANYCMKCGNAIQKV